MTVHQLRPSQKNHLPSAPLAAAIMKLAERSSLGEVCKRAEIAERVVMRWRRGECSGLVPPEDADLAMTRLDLFWWEIWTEDTVREPLFVVTTYHQESKKCKNGVYKVRRIKDQTIPYGDLGTDYWRLREIRLLMSGELTEGIAA